MKLQYSSTANHVGNKQYNSMKLGIPKEVVKLAKIKPKDKILWNITVTPEGVKIELKKQPSLNNLIKK